MPEPSSSYDKKLERILRSAAGVFAEKGYHQASIRDISRATGVSLSGLYYYVDSKEDLLYQIQEHCFGTLLENAERLLSGVADAERRLRIFVENHLRFFVANIEEMKVLSHEAESLTGEYRGVVNDLKRRYTELLHGILRELAPADGVDPRISTFALFGMMNWLYNWYHPERDAGVSELSESMAQLFLRGYLAGFGEAGTRAGGGVAGGEPSIWRR